MNTLGLIVLASLSSAAYAAKPAVKSIEMELSRYGETVCKSTVKIKPGQSIEGCGGLSGENRIQTKLQLDSNADGSVKVTAVIDQISPAGERLTLSNPSIVTQVNEPAEISQWNDELENEITFSVTPRVK